MNRSVEITINGQKYELLFTNNAMIELSERYGGLDELSSRLADLKDISEIIWLIVLLANQTILRKNFMSDEKSELLTVEEVALWTTPAELNDFAPAIAEAISKGTGRNIESEEEPSKNVEVE